MNKFELGMELKDMVTGFKGVATARLEYLNGCIQYCVKPKMNASDKGKYPEGQYIDQEQLEAIDKKKKVNITKKRTGGMMDDTPAG